MAKDVDHEIAFIFRNASAIFGCFLSLFGKEWNIKVDNEIEDCWKFDNYKVID